MPPTVRVLGTGIDCTHRPGYGFEPDGIISDPARGNAERVRCGSIGQARARQQYRRKAWWGEDLRRIKGEKVGFDCNFRRLGRFCMLSKLAHFARV
jgi:hypothetical protein